MYSLNPKHCLKKSNATWRCFHWKERCTLKAGFTEQQVSPFRISNSQHKANRTTHKNFVKFRTGRTVQGLDSEPWYDHTRLNCNQLLEFSIELNDMSQTINVLKWAIILMAVVSILPNAEFGHNDHREDASHFPTQPFCAKMKRHYLWNEHLLQEIDMKKLTVLRVTVYDSLIWRHKSDNFVSRTSRRSLICWICFLELWSEIILTFISSSCDISV